MQHLNEALRVLDVGRYGALGHLKTDAPGRHAAVIECIDDQTQEVLIAQRLAGNVDRSTAVTGQPDLAGPDCGKHRIDHPSIDLRHQLVPFS